MQISMEEASEALLKAGNGGGTSDDQLRLEPDVYGLESGFHALDHVDEIEYSLFGSPGGLDVDRGQVDPLVGADRDVVESDYRDVAGNIETEFNDIVQDLHGHEIAGGEDGGGTLGH